MKNILAVLRPSSLFSVPSHCTTVRGPDESAELFWPVAHNPLEDKSTGSSLEQCHSACPLQRHVRVPLWWHFKERDREKGRWLPCKELIRMELFWDCGWVFLLYLSSPNLAWCAEIGDSLTCCHTASASHLGTAALGWGLTGCFLTSTGQAGAAQVTHLCLLCCSSSFWVQQSSPEMYFPCQSGNTKEQEETRKVFWGLGSKRTHHHFCLIYEPEQVTGSRKISSLWGGGERGLQIHSDKGYGYMEERRVGAALKFTYLFLFVWLHRVFVVTWVIFGCSSRASLVVVHGLCCPPSCGILVPPTKILTLIPYTGRRILNHGTPRKVQEQKPLMSL